jgi:hypothetical protein
LSRKESLMKRYQTICVGIFLAFALTAAWAQNNDQAPADNSQTPTAAPAAAVGPNNGTNSENPPITSLDSPSLEPLAAARSFLQPGAHISQSVDSNVNSATTNSSAAGVTRAFGSLDLQRLWQNYQTSLDYVGGGVFYESAGRNASQLHSMDFDQRVLWRTGELAARDSFSYLPEGSFGYGAYGGAGNLGNIGGTGGLAGGGLGGSSFFGPGQFASIGQQPRLTNTALLQATENLNPRSSVTLTGSYGLVHYFDNAAGFFNSRQITGQAGYNYQLNRKDQLALVYGYQSFHYPSTTGSNFTTHVFNALYGHRISGRMDVIVGGGPQITMIDNPLTGSDTRLSASGRASLRYRFETSSVSLSYDHFNTSGSGLFAGATSDVARFSVNHQISRVWTMNGDVGYTHNTRIQSVTAVNAKSYDYLYAGAGLQRKLGRYFSAYLSYQFNYLLFDGSTACSTPGTTCSANSARHVVLVGLDWHPRPIRID